MPYIEVKVNLPVSLDQERKIKGQLGENISILPGKSENWLMVNIEQNCTLYFQGDKSQSAAFVGVSLYGAAGDTVYNAMTAVISEILERILFIPPSKVYVKYEEVSNWGWNGSNF